jgi:hypothetical protein
MITDSKTEKNFGRSDHSINSSNIPSMSGGAEGNNEQPESG